MRTSFFRGKFNMSTSKRKSLNSTSRKLQTSFKSPLHGENTRHSPQIAVQDSEQQKKLISKLESQIADVDKSIRELENEGYNLEELQTHIDKLHEYNEIKDVGQMMLGKIAFLEGITTRELYPKYDLLLND